MSNPQIGEPAGLAEEAGERFVRTAEPAGPEGQFKPAYVHSWALVIGINDYRDPDIPDLKYAVYDAAGIAELLVTRLGFDRERVFVILDPPPEEPSSHYDLAGTEATRDALEGWLQTRLSDEVGLGPDDRLLIFFAGHGKSRKLPGELKRHKGYLVPSDGRLGAWHSYIQMDDVIEAGDLYEAKHVFYLVDACFSGLTVAKSGVERSRFEASMLTARARQVLSAGTAKQTVADGGPGGHSIFTSYVLQGLGGDAAQEGTQVITASDLMVYVRRQVANAYGSKQTPDFGKLPGHGPGADFLFRLPPAEKLVIDLTEWVPVHDNRGSEIAAIATVAAMEACLAQRGIHVSLDYKQLYARTKEHDEQAGEGTYLRPVIFVADYFGVQAVADETGASGGTRYHARFHPVASLDAIPNHLAEGRPVIAPVKIHRNWFNAPGGEIQMPGDDDRFQGLGGVTIAKYDPNTQVFGFTPHWDVRWGVEGFGSMSRPVAEKLLQLDQMWGVEVIG